MSADTLIRTRDDFNFRAMQYIISGLKDPLLPTKCGGVLDFALSNLKDYEALTDEFWSTLYGFLMAKRTDKQIQTLIERLTDCSCKPDSYGMHATYVATKHVHHPGCLSAHRPHQDSEKLIYTAFQVMNWNLDPERLNVKEVTKGVARKWPHKIVDLIPGGPDQLVYNLIQWHRVIPWTHTTTMTRAILDITKLCGSVIFDSLVKYDATNILVLAPTKEGCDRLLRVLESKGQLSAYDRQLFDTVMTDFVDYITEISSQLPISGTVMNGGETKTVQLCSIILYLIPSLAFACQDPIQAFSLPMISDLIANFARLLYHSAKLHLPGRPSFPVNPKIVDKDEGRPPPRDTPSPDHAIALSMMVARIHHPCSAVSCQLTFTHVANDYKMCNRCFAVGYCSKPCQVRDWKDEWYPHKRICPLICKILEARGGWKAPIAESIVKNWDPYVDGIQIKHDMLLEELEQLVRKMRSDGRISADDYEFLNGWAQRTYTAKVLSKDGDKEAGWHPGYEDYDNIIRRFLNIPTLSCPKPKFMPVYQ